MNPPLRILHVTMSLAPGGMEKVLASVARELTPRGFEFHVACLERSGVVAGRLPNPDNVIVLGKTPGKSLSTVFRLARVIRCVRPHLVHSHNFGPLIYTSAAAVIGQPRPLLHGEHAQLRDRELTLSRQWLRRILYRRCYAVHTVSRELKRQLEATGFRARRFINIENGVNGIEYAPAERAAVRRRLGLPEDAFIIGSSGRLRPEKRHGWLLEATAALAGRFPQVHCLIVGDGPERALLEQKRQNVCTSAQASLVGFQGDPVPFYQAMDLFVLPSRLEGLSNAVLEAMACGVPVLASNACGNGEAIDHGQEGWLFPLASAGELTERLAELLRVPDALPLAGARARARVLRDFPFARTVDRYEQVYRAVAARAQLPTLE